MMMTIYNTATVGRGAVYTPGGVSVCLALSARVTKTLWASFHKTWGRDTVDYRPETS